LKKNDNEKKKNRITKRLLITVLLVLLVLGVAVYTTDEQVRSYINKNIIKSEVTENSIRAIEINAQENPKIYAYSRYISVFSKNELKLYDASASLYKTLNIEISKPLMTSAGRYLVMAENDGKTIYLVEDANIVWKNEVEGNILKINVNENGYVSVIVKNNTYKSIIYVYSPDGTSLFKRYLSSSLAVVTDISKDNKYLVFGEIDYSGISIKSNIEVISIELAVKDPKNSTEIKYNAEDGKIITNIKYTDTNKIVAMYDDSIVVYGNDNENEIYKIENDNIFVDIGLQNNIAIFAKETSGIFAFEYKLVMKNEENEKETVYALNSSIPKKIIVNKNVIGMNFGTEVKIVNSSAWTLKDYSSSKQIKDLVLGTNIAGIVYKDKIEVVSF
jgi:hypothetical protein